MRGLLICIGMVGGVFLKIEWIKPIYSSSLNSYELFSEIQETIIASKDPCELCFNVQKRIGLTFLFYISVLPLFAESNNKSLSITCNKKILDLLYKSDYIDEKITSTDYDIAPLLKKNIVQVHKSEDVLKLVSKITKEAPIKMSEDLQEILASKIGEMYINAMEHSESDYVIGAKYYKNQKDTYCFVCCDFGIGIPTKVMQTNTDIVNSQKAFEWAMKPGNSTVKSDIPRGLGLGLLKDFAQANNGVIRMVSNDMYYRFQNGENRYKQLKHSLQGTLFEMDIIADNKHKYIIK